MRLTDKNYKNTCLVTNKEYLKLGKLEDIEDELEFNLILRHKIEMLDYVYVKEPNGRIIKGEMEGFSAKRKAFIVRARKELNDVLIDCSIYGLGEFWSPKMEELL